LLDWVPGRSLLTGDKVWVPLLAAHLGYDVPSADEFLFPATSNGFAGGATLAHAVVRALLEVVERDAFLISWAHRLAGFRSAAVDVPDAATARLARAYERRGVLLDVYRLPCDSAATVVLAVAWSRTAPAAVVGVGADLNPVLAARRAVQEVGQVRPALRTRLSHPDIAARMARLVEDPSQVETLDDHDLLYADPHAASMGLSFLRDAEVVSWDTPPHQPGVSSGSIPGPAEGHSSYDPSACGEELEQLVASLGRVAEDVVYVDVTPPDVAQLGTAVARGFVTGFQPIHFGANEWRLGGRRLREMPASLGLSDGTISLADLYLDPHPLA
jgi:ribosomal protein S12 methylthiotransferase accessory factor